MKVLVACEYSGRVRDAFIKMNHDAWSCDLLPSESFLGPHYQGDVFDMLNETWDLIIAHSPCTTLTVAGNRHYGEGKDKYYLRIESVEWTKNLWNKCKERAKSVCFENPVGVLPRLGGFPKPNYTQPFQFGHLEQKKTGLILHNLMPLITTNDVYSEMIQLPVNKRQRMFHLPPTPDRWKIRSTTYQGIADAMAEQWGGFY